MATFEIGAPPKVETMLDEFHPIAVEHAAVRYRQLHPFGADQGPGRRQGVQPHFAHSPGRRNFGHRGPEVDGRRHRGRSGQERAPQIIATILVHLEHDHAKAKSSTISPNGCATTWCCASPPWKASSQQPCAKRRHGPRPGGFASTIKKTALGGVRHNGEILNFIGTASETSVLDNAIREYDPDLAQKILGEMFVFENLMEIDDRSHPADPARSPVRFAGHGAQGRTSEGPGKIFRTCPSGPPKCSAKISNPKARCGFRRSRAEKSGRSSAAWPTKARSSSVPAASR